MQIFILSFIILVINSITYGQDIQWASKVLRFSSELTDTEYSSKQLLGEPNVHPSGRESPNAWTPDRENKNESITVGFEKPMKVRQIVIAESYNPSAISIIHLLDTKYKKRLSVEFDPKQLSVESRLLNAFFNETTFNVRALQIEIKGDAVPGYYSIDAIGISNSKIPVNGKINLLKGSDENTSVSRLGIKINSSYREFRPLITPDGNTMFFSRQYHPENMGGTDDPEDIWFSEWNPVTRKWGKAKNIGPPLNNEGPNFVSSITPNGDLLLGNQYMKTGKMMAGVSISYYNNQTWTTPIALNIENDYNISDKGNYFLSNNGEVLLMSVTRGDTFGDRDIYVSFKNRNGDWGEPQNIGSTVNTAGVESAPFLASDDKTLYFSSDGFAGYGGSDIYVTNRLDDSWKRWSIPENLGPKINSKQEDLYLNIPETGSHAYISKSVGDDDFDIYRIKSPMFFSPPAEVQYVALKSIEVDSEISLSANEPVKEKVKGTAQLQNSETNNLITQATSTHKKVRNIYFKFNKIDMLPESMAQLKKAEDILLSNPAKMLTIIGHSDYVGTTKYNQELSKKRANVAAKILITRGIDAHRIKCIGMGTRKPLASNDDELEGRELNRRVEFKFSEEVMQ